MTLVLLGFFLALAVMVLGQWLPQLRGRLRWLVAGGVLAVFLLLSTFKVVSPGHVGVLILFGKVNGSIPEGLHLVNPLMSMQPMSVRTQEMFEHAEVPSKEGLNVALEVTCLYHLLPQEAARVFQQIGTHYDEVVVKPQFRSAIRGTTVRHEAKDLYTSSR